MRLILESTKALLRGLENRYSTNIARLTKKIDTVKSEGDKSRRDLSALRTRLQKVENKMVTVVFNQMEMPSEFGYGVDIAYGNNTYVALGSESLAVSRDCLNWTVVQFPFKGFNGVNKLFYGNGVFVFYVIGGSGSPDEIFYSVDGIAWQPIQIYDNNVYEVFSMTSAGGKMLLLTRQMETNKGCIYTSSDCITWDKSEEFGDINAQAMLSTYIAVSETRMVVIVGYSGQIYYSDDGIIWLNATAPDFNYCSGLFCENGIFMAGCNGRYIYSRNGADWFEVDIPDGIGIPDVCYADGIFIMSTSNKKKWLYSYDGVDWKLGAAEYLCDVGGIAHDGERFVGIYRGRPSRVVWTKDGRQVFADQARLVTNVGEDLTEVLKFGFGMRG